MVRSGLVTAWRLAGWPTSRSPSSLNATIEGVVRMPSAFSMTFGVAPSMTATHELVVPRSIPMTLPMIRPLLFRQVDRAHEAPGKEAPRIVRPRTAPRSTPLSLIPPRGKCGGRGSYKDHDVARKSSVHESASRGRYRQSPWQAPFLLG